jgi:hypothetical protein
LSFLSHNKNILAKNRKVCPLKPIYYVIISAKSRLTLEIIKRFRHIWLKKNAINIYTDGCSLSHPRLGGMGIHIVFLNDDGNEEIENISLPGFIGA